MREDPGGIDDYVLLLEDDPVIALDTAMMLEALGAVRVETALDLEEAAIALDRRLPVFAVLNVGLGGQDSLPVAGRLAQANIPFAFTTGRGHDLHLPDSFAHVPVVEKPYTIEQFRGIFGPFPVPAARLDEDPAPDPRA